ncbi:LuxR C-terminal-related transcriptional regulator [Mycolicibacterium septicum]|uniref:LuxR C-terminal-related transcriptional regulator n=1 Tax=Mycolicibacterium septicum TaxID=98668 RepID=UPI002362A368|nr:LuxR C-terminal-related transcriptional regulator [Mycolicibacterium septicum]
MAEPRNSLPDCAHLTADVQEIVRLAEQLPGSPQLPAPAGDLGAADNALYTVRRHLLYLLQQETAATSTQPRAHLAALLMRAEQLQLAIKDTVLARQRDELENAQAAVSRLRSAMSTEALAERIPTEAFRMGFSRVLFSRIKQGTWLACSAFASDDPDMAERMIEAGNTHPRRLAGALLEYAMVRRGLPMLVRNPQSEPHAHTDLITTTKTTAYVAAPVFSWGRAIGLVHADRHIDADGVNEFDRDTLGMFAEGLGLAFERNLMIERLRAMRQAADEHLRVANALADDFTLEVMELAGPAPAGFDALLAPETGHGTRTSTADPLGDLTSRESEVLRAIAAGKTNAQIATALFVTEGTVKSHVKHILRKLNARNRTEAVARYHQASTSSLASAAYR